MRPAARDISADKRRAAADGGRPPAIIASNFKRIDKNTLLGTVDIEVLAWRLKFKGGLWHQKGDKEWLAFPSREWRKDGQRHFTDLIEITDRSVRDRFQRAALDAVHAVAGEGGQ